MSVTTTWNPMTHSDYDLLKGKEDVFSADGEKVGSISRIFCIPIWICRARRAAGTCFLLDPGLMKDWFGGFNQVYLPESALDVGGVRDPDLAESDGRSDQAARQAVDDGAERPGELSSSVT